LIDALGLRGEIMIGEKIGVHRQIDLDPLEPRHHTGQRAYMLAEARYGGPRRHGAISTAGHDELAAFGDLDRRRRPARTLHLLAAAGGTLRAPRNKVLANDRTRQIEARDVIAQIGAKARGNRFRNFDGSEMKCALPDALVDQGRHGNSLRLSAVEKPLDLPVADHAIEKTVPAGALAGLEHRAHQRKHTGRLHQQPGRLVGHALLVHIAQPTVEIVVDQRDREFWRALGDLNAELAQGRGKLLGALDVDRFDPHRAIAEILFRDFERQAETGPISRDGAIECGRRSRNDVSPLQQPLDRFRYLVGWKALRKLANDLRRSLAIFSDRRGYRTIKLAVQEELA